MMRVLTPEEAAAAIISGVRRNKYEVIAPFMLRIVFMLNRFFPSITRRIMKSRNESVASASPFPEPNGSNTSNNPQNESNFS